MIVAARGSPAIAAIVLLGALLGAADRAYAKSAGDTATWRFKVLLDGREIGFHRFELADTGAGRKLETEASFDVRILFINAFRYRHRNVELWKDGCLERLSAKTDANGEQIEVSGESRPPGFNVSTAAGERLLPGCVASFAYWNPAILGASRLLNTQSGEYETVSVTFETDEIVLVGGQEIEARRFRLATGGGDLRLWYAKNDSRWLALEAPARGGRTLRYEPVSLPDAARVDRLLRDSRPTLRS